LKSQRLESEGDSPLFVEAGSLTKHGKEGGRRVLTVIRPMGSPLGRAKVGVAGSHARASIRNCRTPYSNNLRTAGAHES